MFRNPIRFTVLWAATLAAMSLERLNGGSENFRFGDVRTIADLSTRRELIAAVDLDGDGDLDMLMASRAYEANIHLGVIQWDENQAGQFVTHVVVESPIPWYPEALAGDLDGDGDLDVVAQMDYRWFWLENSGGRPPSFERREPEESVGIQILQLADIDDDGDLDILGLRLFGAYSVIIALENEGGGSFRSRPLFVTSHGFGVATLEAADVDLDGDTDLLISGYDSIHGSGNGAIWTWAVSDGQSIPTFIQQLTFFYGPEATRAYPVDLDLDGDVDVVLAYDYHLRWYENVRQSALGFMRRWQLLDDPPYDVSLTDLDLDGRPDLLALPSHERRGVLLLHNRGGRPPRFDVSEILVVEDGYGPYLALGADVDGDSDVDLIVAIAGAVGPVADRRLVWYPNLAIHDSAVRRAWRLYE